MNDLATAWRPFEPSRDAIEEARAAAERAKKEADELHQRALRNGMPPSGRWA